MGVSPVNPTTFFLRVDWDPVWLPERKGLGLWRYTVQIAGKRSLRIINFDQITQAGALCFNWFLLVFFADYNPG